MVAVQGESSSWSRNTEPAALKPLTAKVPAPSSALLARAMPLQPSICRGASRLEGAGPLGASPSITIVDMQGHGAIVVEELGEGLMVASPVRPVQHVGEQHAGGSPEQGHEEAAHFRHADADQAAAATKSPRLFLKATKAVSLAAGLAKSLARLIASSTCATMARVMCRCQPTQERTSY